MENFKKNALTREEAKLILGGVRDPNGPGCPEGSHIFTCYFGTDYITYCVNDAIPNPDCSTGYPGWPGSPPSGPPGVGVPA